MRIFLTGATGVVGRRAIPLLVGAGHQVTAVARSDQKRAAVTRLGATPVSLDLFDTRAVAAAVAGHDTVINLATHIPPTSRVFLPGAWRENDRLRTLASGNLAEAAVANGASRFIQESFAPIYADAGDVWITETAAIQPARYNRSVLNAERAAEDFADLGRAGVVLRFALFYGPDSSFTLDAIRAVRKGWAPVVGSPDAYLSQISHDDAASAVVAALGIEAGVYNVVDDEPLTRRDAFNSLAAALGVKPPRMLPRFVQFLMGSLGEVLGRSLRISNRKLKQECGWAPRYPSVREGWAHVVNS